MEVGHYHPFRSPEQPEVASLLTHLVDSSHCLYLRTRKPLIKGRSQLVALTHTPSPPPSLCPSWTRWVIFEIHPSTVHSRVSALACTEKSTKARTNPQTHLSLSPNFPLYHSRLFSPASPAQPSGHWAGSLHHIPSSSLASEFALLSTRT